MCNRYLSPSGVAMEREWQIDNRRPWPGGSIFPRALGPFIRCTRDDASYSREMVVGQWGLIPWFAKEPKLSASRANAQCEALSASSSSGAWRICFDTRPLARMPMSNFAR